MIIVAFGLASKLLCKSSTKLGLETIANRISRESVARQSVSRGMLRFEFEFEGEEEEVAEEAGDAEAPEEDDEFWPCESEECKDPTFSTPPLTKCPPALAAASRDDFP